MLLRSPDTMLVSISASQHLSISASQHLSISASQHLSIPASQHPSILVSQYPGMPERYNRKSFHLSFSMRQPRKRRAPEKVHFLE
ncbi:hypothetical protein CYR32_07120 [Chimaeribacter coloradensis]|uniref:Uncharacterized protein n=1 Tax=Chimaeribacter coloradensis TaxID=2060068 RepID=A0A2N5E7W9_9GAMM|nr:hypothetical protein CYR32_07120 [Chimaeribacter coloradensis]